jgi:hypothetical protein
MGEDGRKGLFVLAAILALAIASLGYFLFVEHPPQTQETSSSRQGHSRPPPPTKRIYVELAG